MGNLRRHSRTKGARGAGSPRPRTCGHPAPRHPTCVPRLALRGGGVDNGRVATLPPRSGTAARWSAAAGQPGPCRPSTCWSAITATSDVSAPWSLACASRLGAAVAVACKNGHMTVIDGRRPASAKQIAQLIHPNVDSVPASCRLTMEPSSSGWHRGLRRRFTARPSAVPGAAPCPGRCQEAAADGSARWSGKA